MRRSALLWLALGCQSADADSAGYPAALIDARSRSGDKPGEKDGVPIQYVHVPKAAGTTIQGYLRKAGDARGFDVRTNNDGPDACEPRKFEKGGIYMGHHPIGWGATDFAESSALYIASFREPISHMISVYDYRATHRAPISHMISLYDYRATNHGDDVFGNNEVFGNTGEKISEVEAKLAAEGVPETRYLDRLILEGSYGFTTVAGPFMLPCSCRLDRDLTKDGLAVALHNILRLDVVAITEEFDDFWQQLDYHIPKFADVQQGDSARNRVHRDKQVLSAEALAKLEARYSALLAVERRVYGLAERVSRARTDYARRCTNTTAGDQCARLLAIRLEPEDFDLLNATFDELREANCIVPPAAGTPWPTLVQS